MLNTKTLLEKMVKHFPRWMDIRKRVSTSTGGALLQSVAEETANIQEALEEFKSEFFIEKYFGEEDKVVDFVYSFHIGHIDLNQFSMISHPLTLTTDLKLFYSSTGYVYYEEGYIYFRMQDIKPDERIEYSLGKYVYNEAITKIHVWNIFDEFAAFVGIERHVNENNKDLEKRILNVFKDKMNSSEKGLTHALLTELMILDPTITADEIKIEGVTPENLRLKYDDFNTVLDKIAAINKDCYKYKKWDIDPWYYSISSIDYIPHAWDVAIEAYQDGVGTGDDLNIFLSSPEDTTDASVVFYKEELTMLTEYLDTNNKDTSLDITLSRYKDQMAPVKADYKITATVAYDITNEEIAFSYAEKGYVSQEKSIIELIDLDADGNPVMSKMSTTDNRKLSEGQKYKLRFSPKELYEDIHIDTCNMRTKSTVLELLKAKGEFNIVNGILKHEGTKLVVNEIEELSSSQNLKNSTDGIKMASTANTSTATLNLNNCALENLTVSHNSQTVALPSDFVYLQGFKETSENMYESEETMGETSLMFAMSANIIQFSTSGKCSIVITEGGVVTNTFDKVEKDFFFTSIINNELKDFQVVIRPLDAFEKVSVYDIYYSAYEVSYELSSGNFTLGKLTAGGQSYILPNFTSNQLKITLTSYTSEAPYISHIFIGTPYDITDIYETETFTAQEDSLLNIESTGFNIDLIAINSSEQEDFDSPNTKKNYVPNVTFKSLSDEAYFILNLSEYIEINKLTADNTKVLFFTESEVKKAKVILEKSKEIDLVFIEGTRERNKQEYRLIDLFNVDPEKDDRLYISNIKPGFIVQKGILQECLDLKDIPELQTSFSSGVFNFTNLPALYEQEYIVGDGDTVLTTVGYSGSISTAYIHAKDVQEYVAYNSYDMIVPMHEFIEIEEGFSPFLPKNQIFTYVIKMQTSSLSASFQTMTDDYEVIDLNTDWSLGKNYIKITSNCDIKDFNIYEKEVLSISKKISLQTSIPFDNILKTDEGEEINLCKYVIDLPDGFHLEMTSINAAVSSMESNPEYYKSYAFYKPENGITKLEYCNIDTIVEFYTGEINNVGEVINKVNVPINSYSLNKELGIILWNDEVISELDYSILYIIYTIKIPTSISIPSDKLFEIANYPLEGYSVIGRIDNIENLGDQDTYDLSMDNNYEYSDKVIVHCTNPSFDAELNGNMVTFKRTVDDYALYAKSGYYYVDGQEYYLFAENTTDEVSKVLNATFSSTTQDSEGIHFQKEAINHISNSVFDVDGLGNISNQDFVKYDNLEGVSSINSLTACNTFNYWNAIGCNLSFIDGLNGVGLKIEQKIPNGYCYLNITSPGEICNMSFYGTGDITFYLGEEIKYTDLYYPDSDNIKVLNSIDKNIGEDIYSYSFVPKENYNYYLIAQGNGTIDDIIVDDSTNNNVTHQKNIDILGLKIEEEISEPYTNRVFFSSTKGAKEDGAEFDSTNTIINSSLINWGLTQTKIFSVTEDWSFSEMNNIDIKHNTLLSSSISVGTVKTNPIFIGDYRMLKSLIIKINNVELEATSGFTTKVYSSNTPNGTYKLQSSFLTNTGIIFNKELASFGQYIKIEIIIPANKMISTLTVFSEYKEDVVTPAERISSNGRLISEIYDTQYQTDYVLSNINIEKISNISDVSMEIRAAKENAMEDIWTDWKSISLGENFEVQNTISFTDYRYFQIRVLLKNIDAYIKINYFDLKAVKE